MDARVDLVVRPLTVDGFAPYGTVIAPTADGTPFGPGDAQLDFGGATPRFYAMRIPGRGLEVQRITRHRHCTQALASVGGFTWVLAVAPPSDVGVDDAYPELNDITAFLIPGDVAIMLAKGTWHAGPMFPPGQEQSFFNLELADTNVVDHHSVDLLDTFGVSLNLVGSGL